MNAVTHILPDDCPLSPKEWRALQHLSEGLTYEQIAKKYGLSSTTIRSQLTHVFRKLGVGGGIQAVAYAFRAGWLDSGAFVIPRYVYETKLTPSQWAYVTAFDDYIRTRSQRDRARMVVSCYGVQLDRKYKPKPPARLYHPEVRLLEKILNDSTPGECARIARNIGLEIPTIPKTKTWGP